MKRLLAVAAMAMLLAGCLRNSPTKPKHFGRHSELEEAAASAPLVGPDGRPVAPGGVPPAEFAAPGPFAAPKVVHSPDDGRAIVTE